MNKVFTKFELMKEFTTFPWHVIHGCLQDEHIMTYFGKPLISVDNRYVIFDECPYCGEDDLNKENVCNCCGCPVWWWA